MAVLASSNQILYRDLGQRESQQPHPPIGASCSPLTVNCSVFPTAAGSCRRPSPRAEQLKGLRAFWNDVSRPMAIEMEPIMGVEELDEILDRSKELSEIIIIDWMAAWCRKCIYLRPKLEKLAAEYHPRVKFYFVDVNKVSQDLVKRGNITKMPTIQLWKDGEWKAEVIGGHKAWLVVDEVREMIQKFK